MNKLSFILIFSLICLQGFGQHADVMNELEFSMNSFYKNNYLEQVYVQTDKRSYITGEQILFKVFCREKTSSKSSRLSKVAYFEILSAKNDQLLSAKVELKDGSGEGEIYLPTDISSGNYVMRAYTRWMRNFGPKSFFHGMITIINPFKKLGISALPTNDDISIKFYPESGVPINGISTKVIFDCRYSNGHPAKVKGRLLANDSIEVCTFVPDQNGYGSFEFTPDIFLKYDVELQHPDSTRTTHKFPETKGKGFALRITESKNEYSLNVFCNEVEIFNPVNKIILFLQQKDEILVKDQLRFSKARSQYKIDKSMLQDGIASIALFNENGDYLTSRSILKFENHESENLGLSKSSFNSREEVDLNMDEIALKNADYIISVSAHHENFKGQHLNLTNYLLIENAFNRFIYGLENYFSGDAESVTSNINNLLIAFSHSKPEWLIPFNKKEFTPEYRGALITGKIIHKETNQPETGIYAYASVPGKKLQFNATRSSENGKIFFEMKDFYGANDLVLQTDYTKDTLYSINIDNPFSEEYIEYQLPEINVDESMQRWIEQQSHDMQIKNAYKRYEIKLPVLTERDTATFYIEADVTYFLDDFTRFIVMEEVLREYVYGTNVRKNKDGYYLRMVDLERNIILTENPLMLLDGVAVFDADEIIALDPLKIEKIETVKRRFHKGYLDCHGIISITSYDGDLPGYRLNENALIIEYDGLQYTRQYKFPDYSKSGNRISTIPDFRRTLYWNPDNKITQNDNTPVRFFTSDSEGDYEIIINGFTEDGLPFSKKAYFNVVPSKNN